MVEAHHPVYFHGLPGSGSELDLFDGMPNARLADIFVPIRDDKRAELDRESYMDSIARQIETRFPHGKIHLIGFSLGAFVAIQIAMRLKYRVQSVDLVSAAAPLELGDFLKDMAGKAVFRTAQSSPFLFMLLVKLQSWAARWIPDLLFKAVFANAAGQDRRLADNRAFQKGMSEIMGHSLGRNAFAYRSEIAFYVTGWATTLSMVTQPVTLWQGEADNWTPPAMADALQQALPNVRARHDLKGLSHYSALCHFLEHYSGGAGNNP
jgi:pimeloyl-ACP methyl ester carboxylesterase